MSRVHVSVRTKVLAACGLGAVFALFAALRLLPDESFAQLAVSDLGGLVVLALTAVVLVRTALAFGPGEPLRRQWALVAGGIGLFLVGDAVWAFIEVVQRAEVPYPGITDVFYVPAYFFFGAGLLTAAYAYHRMMDVKVQLLATFVSMAVLAFVLWRFLLGQIIMDAELDLGYKLLSAYYPLANLLFELGPALFVVFIVLRLRGGALAWPWWAVAGGFLVLAFSDTWFLQMDWNETYYSGSLVDLGWMLSYVLVAIGGSLARDVNLVARPAASQREDVAA